MQRGNEKLMDYSVRKEESLCYFVGLSEYVCEYGARKNCFKLAVYLRLWFRLLSHNYLLFIRGMGRFGVVQTSCTNRRDQTNPRFTDVTSKHCQNVGEILSANNC